MDGVVIAGWRLILYRANIRPAITEARMAQRVTVELEDDLDGGPAAETVRFGVDGSEYEIDLSNKNATAFRHTLAPFIDHGRKAGRGQHRQPGRTHIKPAAQRRRPGMGERPGHRG
jgi:Lsr2